ncbi:MAG: hypothetical protein HDR53_02790 [Treponema sp.]|nr:hypothetical protein [Treponema sp.]
MPALVYAALLYSGESPANPPSTNFVQGTATENAGEIKLNFSFQKPDDTSGTFTLEIFAFKAGTSAANFSKENALLLGSKTGLSIVGDTIEINGTIALSVNSSSEVKGTVSLKIKVPEGCSLEIDDTTSDGESRFNVAGTSPDFTVTQAGEGISAGAYQVTFTVKKGVEIVHIFSEYINVFPGMRTDTWSGLEKNAAKEITQGMISSTVYVRGEGGWYDTTSPYNDGETAEADDTNSGSFLSPLASIQKAIDKIIAINDGASEYTIYVDGTLDGKTATYLGMNAMAYISAPGKDLKLTIKALSCIATLDGGARFDANGNITDAGIEKRVITAACSSVKLNLTLENLVIKGGKVSGNGGGICVVSGGGTLTMNGGEISGNTATSSNGGGIYFQSPNGELKISNGTTICRNKASRGGGVYICNSRAFTMTGGEISDNIATGDGGGAVYVVDATFDMSGGTISNCKATSTSSSSGGGGIYNAGTLIISGGTISDCGAAVNGGGIYNNVSDASITSTITNCEISGCKTASTATAYGFGGGIYNASGTLELTDVTITGENDIGNPDARCGGGIYNKGSLTITRGKISNCTSIIGGGVYNSLGTLKITGGTISNCISKSSGGGIVVSGNGTNTTCSSEIINCTIESCVSNSTSTGTSGGGGIYCHQQKLTITGGKISGCKSEGQGGGMSIIAYKFPLKIEGVTITDCNAKDGGGCHVAALVDESVNQEIIKNCIIKSCTATEKGGGIGIGGGTTGGKYYAVTVSGSEISECESPSGSGVFLPLGTSLWLKDSTLKNDVSTSTGTASIYLAGSTTVTEGVIDFSAFTATTKPKLYVQDALSQDSVATIKLGSAYQIGDTILQAAEGYTLTEEDCKRFAIDGGTYSIALVDGEGKLVAGEIYLDSSSGDDANSGLAASNAVKTLSKAIELFDSQYAQKIMVCAAYTLPSGESDLLDRMGGGRRNLPLVRYDGSSDVSSSFTETLLTISQGDVTITNVTLDGRKEKVTASGALLDIDGSTTIVTLGDGATVCNNKKILQGSGSGVHIGDGTFKMIGGTVTGNEGLRGYGLGVYINTNATFEMSGGKISGNSENYSAGGGVYDRGTFIMSGGEISGNKVGSGGGVYVNGSNSYFTMSGGKITGNTATTSGGGVYLANSSTFTMEAGTISSNTATTSGGGVYVVNSSTFTMKVGTVSGNSPDNVHQ